MLVGEIVQRKEYIKLKISEVERELAGLKHQDVGPSTKGSIYSKLLDRLFDLLSKLQSHKALLDKENAESEIIIGESKLSVLDAVHIRNTIERKMDILTEVMERLDRDIDSSDLLGKRDMLMEDLMSVSRSIEQSDWSKDVE